MNLDRVKRKISKLMNLANGTSNEHEAMNAMRKAAALMASYHVQEGDLTGGIIEVKKFFFDINQTTLKGRTTAKQSEKLLFWGIAESMGVYGLYQPAWQGDKNWDGTWYSDPKPCSFNMVGRSSDIEIAWYMFEVCLTKMHQQVKDYKLARKAAGEAIKPSEANDYMNGLTRGLRARFSAMAKADIPEGKGLVPVDTRVEEGKEWYAENGGKTGTSKVSVRNNGHLHSGVSDSSKITINQGVNGGSNTARLSK